MTHQNYRFGFLKRTFQRKQQNIFMGRDFEKEKVLKQGVGINSGAWNGNKNQQSTGESRSLRNETKMSPINFKMGLITIIGKCP